VRRQIRGLICELLQGRARTGEKSSPNKGKMPHNAERSSWCRAQESRKDFTLCEISIFESLRKK